MTEAAGDKVCDQEFGISIAGLPVMGCFWTHSKGFPGRQPPFTTGQQPYTCRGSSRPWRRRRIQTSVPSVSAPLRWRMWQSFQAAITCIAVRRLRAGETAGRSRVGAAVLSLPRDVAECRRLHLRVALPGLHVSHLLPTLTAAHCIIHWASLREQGDACCPQCKAPFSEVVTYRNLDGTLQVGCSWFCC